MHAQDQALLILAAIGFVGAVVTFFVRRRLGKSRALASVYSMWIFGGILAVGVLFGFVPFSKHSIGLERFVVPFVILIGTAVVSSVVGLVVHLIDHREVESSETLPLEAQILLQEVEHQKKEAAENRRVPTANLAGVPAWKQFAVESKRRAGE